ncbi:MAG: thioesterase family protein [Alistipes sp.]|nr:thioesterase family protein [Alistipes sp.]MBO5984492.1 thioesterase family protein [Rikenellaceae bacterium]
MELGLTYESCTVVAESNTALALGSGDMEVFATPAMVALMENAAMLAVKDSLPEGSTTVGVEMQTSHIKASALGANIKASATLVEVDGRRLTFDVKAWDEKATIGEGRHVRFVVDRERFLSKL